MKRLPIFRSPLLLLTAWMLSACAALQPHTNVITEPVTVTFAISNQTQEYYTKQVAAFKEIEPNITIELKNNVTEDIDVREIGWLETQTNNSEILAQALDLSPFIQEERDFNREDYYPGLLDAFSRDGKQLALPNGVDPFVLFYNRDLFDQKGLPYPTSSMTWDEFKTLALQLRVPEANIFGYLPMDGYVDAIFFAYQHGAVLLDGGRPRLDSIESIQALEWYATLFTGDNVAPDAAQVASAFGGRGIGAGVFRGLGAMWVGQFSQLGWYSDDRFQYKVGIAPLPHDETSFSVAQFQGLVISSQTEEPEAAWRWVRYLTTQSQPWSIPARKSVAESDQFSLDMGRDQADIARGIIQNSILINSFDMNLFQPVMDAYLAAVAQTVDGYIPPDATLAEAQQSLMQ